MSHSLKVNIPKERKMKSTWEYVTRGQEGERNKETQRKMEEKYSVMPTTSHLWLSKASYESRLIQPITHVLMLSNLTE
jgi:hypothetical protein